MQEALPRFPQSEMPRVPLHLVRQVQDLGRVKAPPHLQGPGPQKEAENSVPPVQPASFEGRNVPSLEGQTPSDREVEPSKASRSDLRGKI